MFRNKYFCKINHSMAAVVMGNACHVSLTFLTRHLIESIFPDLSLNVNFNKKKKKALKF